jgi:putative transposase
MSSTHLSLHYHLVFGTKNHDSLIASDWRARLHAFLGGVIRTLNGVPEAVGGVADHVHLLVGLRATHTLSDVLREIKSSAWVHENVGVRSFARQEGYGAFTVALRNWKMSALTFNNRRSIIGPAASKMNMWRCYIAVVWNSMSGMSEIIRAAPAGAINCWVWVQTRWLAPPANLQQPSGLRRSFVFLSASGYFRRRSI